MKRAKKSKEKIGNAELSYCARSLVIGIFAATSAHYGEGQGWKMKILKCSNTQILKYTKKQILKYKKTITSVLDLLAASWSGVNCQRSIAFTFAPWVISNSVTCRRKKHIYLHFSEFVGLILSFSSLLSKLS